MTKILFLTTNNVLLGVFPSLQSSDIKTNVVLWLWDQHVEENWIHCPLLDVTKHQTCERICCFVFSSWHNMSLT